MNSKCALLTFNAVARCACAHPSTLDETEPSAPELYTRMRAACRLCVVAIATRRAVSETLERARLARTLETFFFFQQALALWGRTRN